jgi:hypothetical protein
MDMIKAHRGVVIGLVMTLAADPATAAPIINVLHFAKVGYFEHVGGIRGCTTALDKLAAQHDFSVKHSKSYDDLAALSSNPDLYDIVILDNTTDAGGVTNNENPGQKALKDWLMNKGGRCLGIHSAADHRGAWAWYDTVLFSGVKYSNQGSGQFSLYRDTSQAARENPALQNMYHYAADSLGLAVEEAKFNTEYYHFQDNRTHNVGDVRGKPGVTGFQELRGSAASPPNTNQIVGWINALPNKGRFIYTAMGHETAEWTANGDWLTKMTWAYMKYLMGDFDGAPVSVHPPRITAQGRFLRVRNTVACRVRITDMAGRVVASGTSADFGKTLARAGVYFVTVDTVRGKVISRAVVIN